MSIPWAMSLEVGDAGRLHQRSALAVSAPVERRMLRIWRPEATAVVLGSTQSVAVVSADAGVEVVRRRTGGGAVFVGPGELVWADVAISAGDPRWTDDVSRAFFWIGEAWAAAIAALGVPTSSVAVHYGPPEAGRWSSLVCFGGLNPGEVTVAGRKVVGLSQRRTRHGALFQCAALLRWDPAPLLRALALSPEDHHQAAEDLATMAAGIETEPIELEAAFAGALLHD